MANKSPPSVAYWSFMSGHLIALDKKTGILLAGIEETWRQLFSKCVLEVTGPESTHACKDNQICRVLKDGIYGALQGVQYIWDATSTKGNWEFLLIDAKNAFNEINQIGILWTVCHLWSFGAHLF